MVEGREGRAQTKVDQRVRLRHPHRLFDDLDALALQHVGEARVVLEVDVIERGDQLVLVPVPVVEQRRDDAARLELLVETDAVEHFQRGRVIGPGPRHLLEEVMIAQLLDQAHRDAGLRQREREAQPHRAGADDNHAIARRHQSFAATTSLTAPAQPVCVRSNTTPTGSRYFAS